MAAIFTRYAGGIRIRKVAFLLARISFPRGAEGGARLGPETLFHSLSPLLPWLNCKIHRALRLPLRRGRVAHKGWNDFLKIPRTIRRIKFPFLHLPLNGVARESKLSIITIQPGPASGIERWKSFVGFKTTLAVKGSQ